MHRCSAEFCREGHALEGQGTGTLCPDCGRRSSPGEKSCGICGKALTEGAGLEATNAPAPGEKACSRCLRPNGPEARFCSHCGQPLEGGGITRPQPLIGAFEYGTPGGFWLRVLALFIDSIVLTALGLAIFALFGEDVAGYYSADRPLVFADFVDFVLSFLYAPVLIALWSTTVGKRALNLYVVRADGGRCDFWRALGRSFASILSGLLFGIGFLMVAFREDKRALHDLIAGTAVIRLHSS